MCLSYLAAFLVAIVVGVFGVLGVGLLLISVVVGVTLAVRKCRIQRQSKVVTECSDRDPASKFYMHSLVQLNCDLTV